MIDERLGLVTPEGAELNLSLAGPVPRTAAFLIDLLIRGVVYVIAAIVMLFLGSIGNGVMLILMFLLEWFYPVFFEVFRHGQTPGKKALGLPVTHADGTPVTVNGSLLRNLLRSAYIFLGCYLAGYLTMQCNRRLQLRGDLATYHDVTQCNKHELQSV